MVQLNHWGSYIFWTFFVFLKYDLSHSRGCLVFGFLHFHYNISNYGFVFVRFVWCLLDLNLWITVFISSVKFSASLYSYIASAPLFIFLYWCNIDLFFLLCSLPLTVFLFFCTTFWIISFSLILSCYFECIIKLIHWNLKFSYCIF